MLSNTAKNSILNALAGNTQYAILASTAYLGLSSTEPQANGTGVTEPVTSGTVYTGANGKNGYKRYLLGNYNQSYSQKMNSATNGLITNKEEIHFNEVTSDTDSTGWGQLVYACIFNSASGGTLVAWGELGAYSDDQWTPVPINPATNNVVVIKEGDLRIKID